MLSNLHAAELQFRHEARIRDRELALLGSIRDRRAAQTPRLLAVAAPLAPSIAPRRAESRATRTAWARPIGVKTCSTTACATA